MGWIHFRRSKLLVVAFLYKARCHGWRSTRGKRPDDRLTDIVGPVEENNDGSVEDEEVKI